MRDDLRFPFQDIPVVAAVPRLGADIMLEVSNGAPKIAAPLGNKETARLFLRRFESADLDALAIVFAKPEVWQFPYGRAFTREETAAFLESQMREWEQCGFGCWIATGRQSRRVIGYVGICVPHFLPEILPAVEVGWRFDPDVWGRGYATEGATAALDEAFTTLGLNEVCSAPQTINPPSSRVCDRLGMRLERVVTAAATQRRGAVDANLYWITKDEWLRRQVG